MTAGVLVRLVAAVLALVAGATAARASAPPADTFKGLPVASVAPAPDFSLHDQHGRLVRLSALRGKLVLVSFLYTHCPDVCPRIASELGSALRLLGPAAAGVRALAVSVDPARDTPAAVKRFVAERRLPSQFHYLTGARSQLEPVWRAYHLAVLPGSAGIVVHSAFEILIDQHGDQRLLYDSQITGAALAHDLRPLGAR